MKKAFVLFVLTDYWTETFSYLSLPVLFKGVFPFVNGDLFVYAGPAAQYSLTDGSEARTEVSGGFEFPVPVPVGSFNLWAMAGAGYSLAVFGGEASFELRYIQGGTRSYDQDALPDDHRTWSIMLIGGYGYRIK